MKVQILEEHGHELALRGMAYSYKDRALDPAEWWPGQRPKAYRRANVLAHRDGGHNKFMESIQLWIDIEASRAWWSEADTYRVGTTKQSESTMHTLAKRPPLMSDFEVGTDPEIVSVFLRVWEQAKGDITALKMNLPEGFLQRRLLNTNYKALRNILWQREGHRLKQWDTFREQILAQVKHPQWLVEGGRSMSLLRHLTRVEGTTVAQLAEATGQTIAAVRAELVALETQGKAVRQRAAIGQPHLWWQTGRKPLSSLDSLLAMALAARLHTAPGKLRGVIRRISTRVVDPLGRSVVQMVATASNPHAVVAKAVEYHFEDEAVPA